MSVTPTGFAARATIAMLRAPPLHDVAVLTARVLLRSFPVVFIVALASGAMLTIQAAGSLAAFGARSMSGLLVGFGGVREVFPLLAAGSLSARTGAEFASQLGAMKTGRQIEALEVMGLDPLRLVVAPRVIAAMLGAPLCVLLADLSGLLGGFLVGTWQLGIDRGAMWTSLMSAVVPADFAIGAAKGLALGWLIGVVSTYEGMIVEGGAVGVGRAANRAVIRSMVVVCSTSLLLSFLLYGHAR